MSQKLQPAEELGFGVWDLLLATCPSPGLVLPHPMVRGLLLGLDASVPNSAGALGAPGAVYHLVQVTNGLAHTLF